jgi:peptidase C39-like protein
LSGKFVKIRLFRYGLFVLLLSGLSVGIYNLPPVKNRLEWRLDELQARIKYAISPPEQTVFVPSGQAAEHETRLTPTPWPTAMSTATPLAKQNQPSSTYFLIPTLTTTPTSIPDKIQLSGFRHEYQGWNNCGPATLAMALSFWGWKGDQYDIAPIVKPNSRDKNVMPAELADYVESQTRFKVVVRVGGELDLLKRLVAAGYPVIVEKGFESPKVDGWMGHYELITGYDNSGKRFTAQDSYMGPDLQVSSETIESNWRAFNFTYLVIFPVEREPEVAVLLGSQMDKTFNKQYAAQKAEDEISTRTVRDLYFAWFNRGSSLVALQDYVGAADAFDRAFAVYPSIPKKSRPWRMLWYQTGPYQAYYYTGRYQDVIDLATETLNNMSEPVLEEGYYWRALAKVALGDEKGALDDLQRSLKYHPGFEPSLFYLHKLTSNP